MKTIVYSEGEKYYYILELACGHCNWISVAKFDERPKSPGWIDHSYLYDNEYYREARPFTFWKIKELGNRVKVEDDHELVLDYQGCRKHEGCGHLGEVKR